MRPVPGLGVPLPAYDGRSIANLAVSVFRAAGAELAGPPPVSPPLAERIDPFHGERAPGPVVVFLVDGLGWGRFREWAQGSPDTDAQLWGAMATPITTVFPTTTSSALVSLSTGTPPGRHGLVGYRQFLPQYGVVADMLRMSPVGASVPELLVGPRWQPSDISGCPSLFRRSGRGAAVSRDRFEGSGLTRILYDGAPYVPYATVADLAHELVRLLSSADCPPVLYLYWDELDTIQHLKGPRRELFAFELERLAHLVRHIAGALPEGRRRSTTWVITGDHGQVPATPEARIALETIPSVLKEMARPLAGDRRAGFFVALPGRVAELSAALEQVLPAGSQIFPMDRVIESGAFGPPPFHPELAARTGDLLVLVPPPAGLTYLTPGAARPSRFLLGAHGGLTPDELLVPLVCGTLDQFVAPPGSRSQR